MGMARPLINELEETGRRCGLDAFGVTTADPFEQALVRIEELKERGLHGDMWFTFGRPERSTDPRRIVEGARSIIVGAIDYHRDGPDGEPDNSGAVARYVWHSYYHQLEEALLSVAEILRGAGWAAEVVLDDNRLVDRAAAHRAGLGWFGKNTNLLIGDLGSWFVLGCVVTDCELPTAPEPMPGACGTCVRCQVECPTGALDEEGVLDARRCLAWLLQADGVFPIEHRIALGRRIYGCDDCQEVCPFNSRITRARELRPSSENADIEVGLVELLKSDDDELMARFGHWYIPRRRPEYLRRNALVALGNTGSPGEPAVRQALEVCLGSESSIVRSHAVWTAKRLGLDPLEITPLLLEAGSDDEGLVATELSRDVPLLHDSTPDEVPR